MTSLLTSSQIAAVFACFWLGPSVALKLLAPRLALPLCLASTAGFLVSVLYFVPAGMVPLVTAPLVILVASVAVFVLRRKQLSRMLRDAFGRPRLGVVTIPVVLVLLYSCLPFLARWGPSGGDSTMWGYLSRHLYEQGGVTHTLAPLFFIDDLRSFNLGIPALIATLYGFAPFSIERWINLSECLTLALFIYVSSAAARRVFDLELAYWAGFAGLVIFNNPQLYVDWGGTPTLLGMTFGPSALLAVQLFHDAEDARTRRRLAWTLGPVIALAFAAAAHAHAIGVVTSGIVAVAIYFGRFGLWHLATHVAALVPSAVFTVAIMSPFVLNMGSPIGPSELLYVLLWQEAMAPLVKDDRSFFAFYQQLASYLGPPSTVLLLIVAAGLTAFRAHRRLAVLTLLGFLLTMLLLTNVGARWLPAWYLWYPGRVGTAFVILAIATLAAFLTALSKLPRLRRTALSAGALALLVVGFLQFRTTMWFTMQKNAIDPWQAEALAWISDHTPKDAVFDSVWDPAWKWLPAISYRMTTRCHPPSVAYYEEASESVQKIEPHYGVKTVVGEDPPGIPENAEILKTLSFEIDGQRRTVHIYRW